MSRIQSRRRAMTLIEILVVVVVGLLVVGLVVEALILTNRATDELTAREGMRQEAMLIAQSVEKLVRFRVAPEELTPKLAAGTSELYSASELRLCAPIYGAAANQVLQQLSTVREENKAQFVGIRPADAAGGDLPTAKHLGASADRYKSVIAFRYAVDYQGLEPVWSDQVTTTPKVVEYTVRVWPNDPKMAGFEQAQDSRGRHLGFRLTGAVKLP